MKKHKWLIIFLVTIVVLIYFLKPISLASHISEDEKLIVFYNEFRLSDGMPSGAMYTYEFEAHSSELKGFINIIGDYRYHRSFVGMFLRKSGFNDIGSHTLLVYSGENRIHFSGLRRVIVNDGNYLLGYFEGNEDHLLVNDLVEYLKQFEPVMSSEEGNIK